MSADTRESFAHRAVRESPEYRARDEVADAVRHAVHSVGFVGLPLGQWTARRDWAAFSQEACTGANTSAFADFHALAELTAARERLAVAASPNGEPT